jgi:hypothetical protein
MRGFLKFVVMAFLAMLFVVTLNAQGDLPPAPASSPEKNISATTSPTDSLPSGPASSEGLPDGFVLYEDQKSRFAIGIPSDWIAIDLPPFPGQQDPPISSTSFSQPPNAKDKLWQRVVDIHTGVTPSFELYEWVARDGMSCDGFSEKARAKVFKMAQEHSTFSEGSQILKSLRSEPVSFAGCKGIRIYGSGTALEPEEEDITWSMEVRAVAGAKTFYLFILRTSIENFKKNAEIFQKSVATFKLPPAK